MFYSKVDTVEKPALFTPWSLVHATTGVLIQSLLFLVVNTPRIALIIGFVLHLLYETFDFFGSYNDWFKPFHDNVYKFFGIEEIYPALFSNSWQNSVGDILSFTFGQLVAWYLVIKKKLKKTALIAPVFMLLLWFIVFGNVTNTLD